MHNKQTHTALLFALLGVTLLNAGAFASAQETEPPTFEPFCQSYTAEAGPVDSCSQDPDVAVLIDSLRELAGGQSIQAVYAFGPDGCTVNGVTCSPEQSIAAENVLGRYGTNLARFDTSDASVVVASYHGCIINVGYCAGSCWISVGACIGGSCIISVGVCFHGGSCIVSVGVCAGRCAVNVGHCARGASCIVNVGQCGPGGRCVVNVGSCGALYGVALTDASTDGYSTNLAGTRGDNAYTEFRFYQPGTDAPLDWRVGRSLLDEPVTLEIDPSG